MFQSDYGRINSISWLAGCHKCLMQDLWCRFLKVRKIEKRGLLSWWKYQTKKKKEGMLTEMQIEILLIMKANTLGSITLGRAKGYN